MRIKNISYTVLAALALIFQGCTEDETVITEVLADTTRGAALRTLDSSFPDVAEGSTESTFTGTFEIQSDESAAITSVNVYGEFIDNTGDSPGDASGLIGTVSTFNDTEFGLQGFSYTTGVTEILGAAGVALDAVEPGDQYRVRFELVAADGRTFSFGQNTGTLTGGYFRSPFQFTSNVICAPLVPTSGTWTVVAVDSYGDGWNGGNLSITIDDNDPITLANTDGGGPYPAEVSQDLTFEVPAGAQSIQIVYNGGSFDEEVTFQVISANGNTILDLGPEPATSTGLIDYCLDLEL
ncbi:hypothetical protein DZC72_01445 [Maribacter algicola]|uniref:Uncharacterized protein n=1 Tax=Maribacter algicola TaxID=2498892 RepID=A0A3R8R8L8_9FLAO|nr:hypothetical protein [Maribacter algicola]RRQ49317.1 hypothetical protein DZC72_01445 [Maribacter algicola]